MIRKSKILGLLVWTFFIACSPTRHLPEGDSLYTGASVTLNAEDISSKENKVFKNDLEKMTRPRPNSKVLGVPVKLIFWNMFRAKKETSFFGKLRSKFGEPPVLGSEVDLNANNQILSNFLENKGFFNARVTGDTTTKNKKTSAHYTANAGKQYKISSIEFLNDSSNALAQAILASKENSLLQIGKGFDLNVIRGERERIDAFLKERGYYYFSPDFLLIQADSTVGDHQVRMKVIIKPDIPEIAKKVYYINDVFVYSDYSLNTARVDTLKSEGSFLEGYHVIDPAKKFNPQLFKRTMQFEPNEIYNRTDHNRSLSRLMNLNVFKFVKNRFERAATDSPKLDVYYYLTPFPSEAIRAEVGAHTKSNNLNGSQVTFGYHHRNFLRTGEQFDLKLFGGTEAQFSGAFQGYNTYRLGGEINFGIPRFITPFRLNTRSGYVPRTNIHLGYELLNRRKLYTLNSFRTALGYVWRESQQKSHEFYPISVTYVLPANITQVYRDEININPTLRHITDTQFILGSTYQFTLNQRAGGIQKTNEFYFNGLADISGNLAGLLFGQGNKNQKRLFNLPFSQYLKFEADGRYYRKLGLKSSWANRIVFGYGLPYGNSDQIPYIKQFFTGGNNSIRAFRSRTVGPGSFKALPTSTGFIPDQTGDIKLELNTEFRPHITGPLYGALFVDAGNIWLKNESLLKPGAKFDKDFLKELAVGTGAGLRLDIQIFVIRFDVAFPIRKPWLPPGQRWVTNKIKFGDPDWRKENLIFNLAIGYPF